MSSLEWLTDELITKIRVYVCLCGTLFSLGVLTYCIVHNHWGWFLFMYAIAFDEVRDLVRVKEEPSHAEA